MINIKKNIPQLYNMIIRFAMNNFFAHSNVVSSITI